MLQSRQSPRKVRQVLPFSHPAPPPPQEFGEQINLSVLRYLPNFSLAEYLERVRARFPDLEDMLDFERTGAPQALLELENTRNEFETDEDGRGDAYRRSQLDTSVRSRGISSLLSLTISDRHRHQRGPRPIILDLLGGDGTVARCVRDGRLGLDHLRIITSDIAGAMIQSALELGLESIRQPAQFLFMKDQQVDGVFAAYGLHHVPPEARSNVCEEAFRALRPDGRFVLHDFEQESPIADWFEHVVDRHSTVGHDYVHFTRGELRTLLTDAGFVDIHVTEMYDPLVVKAPTDSAAVDKMCTYVMGMYGLKGLLHSRSHSQAVAETWRLCNHYMRYEDKLPAHLKDAAPGPSVRCVDGSFVAEIPRIALVAHGRRG